MYVVNLDLEEGLRWKDIIDSNKEKIDKIKHRLLDLINNLVGNFEYILMPLVNTFYWSNLIMYKGELNYLAEQTGLTFTQILTLQLCYEACACCTSVITNVSGEKIFFRTMDWPYDFLKELTIDIEFQKNNTTVFYATSWIGYVGILTATLPKKYSLAINFRSENNLTFNKILENLKRLINMYWPTGYLIRYICENSLDEIDMNSQIVNCKTVSPFYLTVLNNLGESYVINSSPSNEITLSPKTSNYTIQTNCDFDKFEPDILYSVHRRQMVIESIKSKSNNFNSIEELIQSLYRFPVLNEETIYLCLMTPILCTHESIINKKN